MNVFQYLSQSKFLDDPKFLLPMLIWITVWKGLALWRAAQRKESLWFWLIMIMNTLGILEICYIFVFSRSNIHFKDLTKKFIKKSDNQSSKKEEMIIEPIDEHTEETQDNQ